jgi:hypothetical protein
VERPRGTKPASGWALSAPGSYRPKATAACSQVGIREP